MSGQQDFYQALGSPEGPLPTGLHTWNGSDPGRRFAVYRNNVLASLIDALADSFPVVQALVGEPFFRAMAQIYVRECPPESPILAEYGDRLPLLSVSLLQPPLCPIWPMSRNWNGCASGRFTVRMALVSL